MALTPRHIQNLSAAAALEPHWGYADRAVPCTNDPGSCDYLDVVYASHDRGMVYTGIFWLTILGIVLALALGRRIFPPRDDTALAQLTTVTAQQQREQKQQQPQSEPESHQPPPQSTSSRAWHALSSASRHYLLPSSPLFRALFGHTTRLQVLVLAVLASYLAIWSFVGITYATWVTPVRGEPEGVVNTRTSLGPWSNRVGVLAYALTPLSVLLASRESVLSLLTGIPYTSFMFLHRWTGYIILAQSLLHTLGWVLIEAWLYRPQPSVWQMWVSEEYAVWGFVALALLVLLWIFSLQAVISRVTGYEFFRKAHYVLAMVYIGALIGHWEQLQCFLVPGLVLWGADRAARLVRTGLLHYGYLTETRRWGFRAVNAEAKFWKDEGLGNVVRLDFDHAQSPWKIGQHFFLCFTEGSIWQSHPFTPLSLPIADAAGKVRHSYIFRAKKGETRKIAEVVAKKIAASASDGAAAPTTPVILQGPYGENIVDGLTHDVNVLCVAGGTGITYVFPVLLRLVRGRANPTRKIELVWAVKKKQDLEWVEPEMKELRRLGAAHNIKIQTFVTAEPLSLPSKDEKVVDEKRATESSEDDVESQSSVISGHEQRPAVSVVVNGFIDGVAQGPTRVFGSGPPSMITDLRRAVAKCNSGAKVWKGEERFDVRLVCDDRLEW
ncbi:Ferric reductase transmembrane component 3 [Madurella mycetomatis]|uniref:Ferric reductase transmembrane component 3 n=1 Tax=Madurella mycetomatis TaxID=100816 RepID=A0A175VS67_9PEZI|nr:Ferric reductase transmembrane component 3 [Madurella mycetomatis]